MAKFEKNMLNRTRAGWLTLLMCSFALLPMLGTAMAPSAKASDLDSPQAEAPADGSHFIRIGWKKSVVIRLPAEARDVIVGDPGVVDAVIKSKDVAYLFAREYGQTNIFFFDKDGQQILSLDIEVTGDTTALRKLLDRSMPGNHIKVESINSKIVLTGTVANVMEAQKAVLLAASFAGATEKNQTSSMGGQGGGVINALTIAGEEQVMLKVRIAEVQRSVVKQFGVNMQAMFTLGDAAFNLTSAPAAAAASGVNALFQSGGTSIQGILRVMENDGMVKTLAEPNLTAVSGQAATFNAGGEVPVQVCSGAGAALACSVDYKKYGVILSFTPSVQSDGRISLKVKTEVSDIGAAGVGGNPTFDTRGAETTVELPSGGSMMLAGLIKDSTRQNIEGIPGLRKLPVLGALFRSRDFQQKQSELVVIVTPYLVNSTTEKALASPTDGLNIATDKQTLLLGRLNKIYGVKGKHPDGVYHGNVGFIVE